MKNVALVLSSGSSRGMAHIGAIKVLLEHGYQITSIAGTSMGAIVGGMYAAGKLEAFERWCQSLDWKHIVQLVDFSLTHNAFVKGEHIMEEFEDILGDVRIEDLPIPLSIVATDFQTGREVVIETGRLTDAIRASMSLPLFFHPYNLEGHELVDGGLSNPLPLDRVKRTEGDILVSVNVSAPEQPKFERPKTPQEQEEEGILDRLFDRLSDRKRLNYLGVLTRTIDIMIQHNTQLMEKRFVPDMKVDIPMNYYDRFAFTDADLIIAYGKELMERAIVLDPYTNLVSAYH